MIMIDVLYITVYPLNFIVQKERIVSVAGTVALMFSRSSPCLGFSAYPSHQLFSDSSRFTQSPSE